MKECEWCNKFMLPQNYNKHIVRCFYKVHIGLTKNEIDKLKLGLKSQNEIEVENIEMIELRKFYEKVQRKSQQVSKKFEIIKTSQTNYEDKINELLLEETTKKAYHTEWRKYRKWLANNNLFPSKESGDKYLGQLSCQSSTLRKKQYMLQSLLETMVDSSIHLNKVRKRVTFKPKYSMTYQEIRDFMKEQEEIDFEDYVIQRLMLTFGLRINTIASLKISHLEFLNGGDRIVLPDSKVKRMRFEDIDDDIREIFDRLIEMRNYDEDDFVFYRDIFSKSTIRRSHWLCVKINSRIKQSKVLSQSKNFQFSSHMFRKTKAYINFNEGLEKLKEQTRASIGQSVGSSAIEHYISHTF